MPVYQMISSAQPAIHANVRLSPFALTLVILHENFCTRLTFVIPIRERLDFSFSSSVIIPRGSASPLSVRLESESAPG
jgi:hypothetical protein